jgi:hypothetical protein
MNETRKWAIELALKAGAKDVVAEAERILSFVEADGPVRPTIKRYMHRVRFAVGWKPTEEQRQIIRDLYITRMPVTEIRDRVNEIGNSPAEAQNVRRVAINMGLRRPPECVTDHIRKIQALRSNGAKEALGE